MCCRVNVSARHVQTISTIMLTRRLESSQLAWWLVGFLATSLKTWSKCGRLCSISRGEPGCRCRCRPVPIFGGSTAGAAVVDRTGVPCALRRSSSSSDLRSCTGERSCSSGSCRFARIPGGSCSIRERSESRVIWPACTSAPTKGNARCWCRPDGPRSACSRCGASRYHAPRVPRQLGQRVAPSPEMSPAAAAVAGLSQPSVVQEQLWSTGPVSPAQCAGRVLPATCRVALASGLAAQDPADLQGFQGDRAVSESARRVG